MGPSVDRVTLTSTIDADAVAVATELGGLPLALATAGAYLGQVSVSWSTYLRLYKESWRKLQQTSPGLGSYEDRTLYSTWQISYDHVQQRSATAAQVLRFWAYLDNRDIWFELVQHVDDYDPEWMQALAEDEISFHQVMCVLTGHGLVDPDPTSPEQRESAGYSMHSCVHSWTMHVLNQAWDQALRV